MGWFRRTAAGMGTPRDRYNLKGEDYRKWVAEQQKAGKGDELTFGVRHWLDNIWKVHRPGKVTYRSPNTANGKVPPEEIDKYAKLAQSQGFTDAFVLLPDPDLIEYYGSSTILFDTYKKYGITPHRYPIDDYGIPGVAEMILACRDLKATNDAGGKIFVHCSAGVGRTGLLTSCYLAYTGRLSSEEIQGIIENNTSVVGKDLEWQCLRCNSVFKDSRKPYDCAECGSTMIVRKDEKPKPVLNEMQQLVKTDTSGQMDFLLKFAKLKERVEGTGIQLPNGEKTNKLDDPQLLKTIQEQDRVAEQKRKEEREKREQQRLLWEMQDKKRNEQKQNKKTRELPAGGHRYFPSSRQKEQVNNQLPPGRAVPSGEKPTGPRPPLGRNELNSRMAINKQKFQDRNGKQVNMLCVFCFKNIANEVAGIQEFYWQNRIYCSYEANGRKQAVCMSCAEKNLKHVMGRYVLPNDKRMPTWIIEKSAAQDSFADKAIEELKRKQEEIDSHMEGYSKGIHSIPFEGDVPSDDVSNEMYQSLEDELNRRMMDKRRKPQTNGNGNGDEWETLW